MKGYKGFDNELKCRGYQYEVGKTYETDKAELCETGFHFCECPLDVFGYYPPADNGRMNRYCEVEAEDVSDEKGDDSKRVSKKLSVGAEIGIPGLVKAHIEYVKATVTDAIEKGDAEAATAGYKGAATAGEYGAATAKGSAMVGAEGIAVVRGNNCKAMGGIGSVLVIVEENEADYGISVWKAGVVDGKTLKADTWYTLKDGEFVKVEE